MPKKRKDNSLDQCRGCLSTCNLSPLLSAKIVAKLFQSLTSIAISAADKLPKMICKNCKETLYSFDAFRKNCIKVDKLLRNPPDKCESDSGINNDEVDHLVHVDKVEVKEEESGVTKVQSSSPVNSRGIKNYEVDHLVHVDKVEVKEEESDVTKIQSSSPVDSPSKPIAIVDNGNRSDSDNGEFEEQVVLISTRKEQLSNSMKTFEPRTYKTKLKLTGLKYKCNQCNRLFLYEERLRSHLREHDGKKAFPCELCNKEYSGWTGLKKHIELKHTDSWPFRCTNCDISQFFCSDSALTAHMSLHTEASQQICENCGKAFANVSALKKHFFVHRTETPFECNECGKKFKSHRHLHAHKFRHKGIRNFACQSCEKTFISRPELRQHMLVHTCDQNFHCLICRKSFRYKRQEILHMRAHHLV